MGVGPASPFAPGDVSSRRCLNGGAELHGAYCAACGQREVVDPNPSLRHLHAAFYFLLAVSQLTALLPVGKLSSVVSVAIALYLIWYVLAALRHVYGGSWNGTFARLSVISVLYSVVLMFAFLGSLALAVVSA